MYFFHGQFSVNHYYFVFLKNNYDLDVTRLVNLSSVGGVVN
ncbi:hypothetical protein SOHN41_02612 [Shewanella sp. HN-41]|nr:hypothetical protein SOHN41_02612 [Shewanella sp. HN-41]